MASGIRAALEQLREASGETTIDAVLAGQRSIYLDVLESREMVRYTAQVGDARPLARLHRVGRNWQCWRPTSARP
ncbi:MAG: hypothetical protein R3E68_20265 [Burkholderiaceae bacterium]